MTVDTRASTSFEDFEARISKARAYAQRLGTDTASSPNSYIFINGKHYAPDDVCSTATLIKMLYLIADGAELPELAAVRCRTGTSVLPRKVTLLFPCLLARC